jgi:hypothetical protein
LNAVKKRRITSSFFRDIARPSVDWTATGEASGIETSSRWYLAFWVRDGKIARMQYFRECAEALDAAGVQG